ncbi:MAG: hypothetical protein KUG79_11900 [Pseudomonadales bacterium]|nr:hypothetical protein [Pseudomonadales bacterium]
MSTATMMQHKFMNDRIKLNQIFPNSPPSSATCLEYNLCLFNQNSDTLFFDTVKFVYQVFVDQVHLDSRLLFLDLIIQDIKLGEKDASALLIFIHYDSSSNLVSTAVAAYLEYRPSTLEDPFVATEELISILVNRKILNRGAAFAGLVFFGDRRVCSAARTIRGSITAEEANNFASVTTHLIQRSSVEFCLSWLMDLVDSDQPDLCKPIANALSAMVANKPTLRVQDTHYNFGTYGFSSKQRLPEVKLSTFIKELNPVLEILSRSKITELEQMIKVFRDPFQRVILQQQRKTTRRKTPDRRASDRRVIDITPHLERRRAHRREGPRRLQAQR